MNRFKFAILSTLVVAPLLFGQPNSPFVVKTLAGSYSIGNGGPATAALLAQPAAVTVDAAGNLYIADGNNNGVRKVVNGTINALFNLGLVDLKMDASGNFYGTDGFDAIYKISSSGTVTTIAGGAYGYAGDGGPAVSAQLALPGGIAVDGKGDVYIADTYNLRVRMVTPDGKIQTVAGNGKIGFGGDGGPATTAPVNYPNSVAVDGNGNLYIGEAYRIRMVTPQGFISTIAGNGNSPIDGAAVNTAVGYTLALTVDSSGSLYLADYDNSLIRVISTGAVKTLAGTSVWGYSGDGGAAAAAKLHTPTSVALDASGNLYFVDQGNECVRKITKSGTITTVVGGPHYGGDGGPATSAVLGMPEFATGDGAGNVYVADTHNHRIRKITPDGKIATIAGNGVCGYSGDGGPAAAATICYPSGLAFDASSGTLYFSDSYNSVIRTISNTGIIRTYAGSGTFADLGDGKNALAASFEFPMGLALDSAGNLYVADYAANRVRAISAKQTVTGVAGSGDTGFGGDGALATAALLNGPIHVAADPKGNVYIADMYNNRIRKVSNGTISTVAGVTNCCGTGINAANTYIGAPRGIAVDVSGNLYIGETDMNMIAEVTPAGAYSVIAGTGSYGFAGDGGFAAKAMLDAPGGLWLDSTGVVYFTDEYDGRIRELIPDTPTGITVLSGDGQTAMVSAAVANPLTVQVTFRGGVPVAGVPVTFGVIAGSATLSTAAATTDPQGLAGVAVTMGASAGAVVVTATLPGYPPVQFHLTATTAIPLPTISAGGVDGAGGSVPAVAEISPGGLASIYGSAFAPPGTSRTVGAADLVNGSLPTSLAGVCVTVNGVPAFLTFVGDTQINIQVPAVPVSGNASIVVTTNCGTANAVQSLAATVPVAAATPEFLYWVKNSSGRNPVIAVNAVTGAYVATSGSIPGITFTAAKPGDILTIFGVSFGPTNPAVTPGMPSSDVAQTTTTTSVMLGSLTMDAGDVLYAGISPGTAGLYQLNIRVPAGLADGDYPLTLTLGQFSTPAGGFLTVKN